MCFGIWVGHSPGGFGGDGEIGEGKGEVGESQTWPIPKLHWPPVRASRIIPIVVVWDFCLGCNELEVRLERYGPMRLVNAIPIN